MADILIRVEASIRDVKDVGNEVIKFVMERLKCRRTRVVGNHAELTVEGWGCMEGGD